ncbi:MAG TPA: TonB-dependent receptor [Solimonas sp.]|nr:TonB-dependent receptor [Solimonas sp.]
MSTLHRFIRPHLALLAGLAWAGSALAAGPVEIAALPEDLTQLSLEDLLNVEVTSVSRRAEPLFDAAAAVFVLTGEEIRRSGVRSIAEALRLVPGLQVARPNVHAYAISARGFNNTSADKMEVLLDGRSVYTPLSSAVFWDVLETYLPDIDRIEVIRGPGATLWGANAVNGVINIVTRSAQDTQGISAVAYAGNEERYGAGARLGARVGEAGSVRLYAQGLARDESALASGKRAPDGMRMQQAGMRSDWSIGQGTLTVSGDGYDASEQSNRINGTPTDTDVSGGDVLARWTCCAQDDGRWSLQGSYDGYVRNAPTVFSEQRRTGALDFQQQWELGASHTVVYGLGARVSHDTTGGVPLAVLFVPAARTLGTYSAFVQDQMSMLDRRASLTLGSKFEYTTTTGFEVQPSIRFGWQASEPVFIWAAVSRAVRTPNRIDQDVAIFCPPPDGFPGTCGPDTLLRIGNPGLDSEKVLAYEWGLRVRSGKRLSWDLATYYNDYSELRSTESSPPFFTFDNRLRAHGYGAELSAIWQAGEHLQLRPFYSFLALHAQAEPGSSDIQTAANLEGSNPRHQAGLRAAWDPAPRWNVDSFLRYVAALPRAGTPSATSGSTRVPAYAELDLRLAYSFPAGLELGLVGANLLDSRHPEFGPEATRSELQRSLLLELRWSRP